MFRWIGGSVCVLFEKALNKENLPISGLTFSATKDSGNIEGVAYTTGVTNPLPSSSPDGSAVSGLASPTTATAQQSPTYIEVLLYKF